MQTFVEQQFARFDAMWTHRILFQRVQFAVLFSASEVLALYPFQELCPGPRWGTFVLQNPCKIGSDVNKDFSPRTRTRTSLSRTRTSTRIWVQGPGQGQGLEQYGHIRV